MEGATEKGDQGTKGSSVEGGDQVGYINNCEVSKDKEAHSELIVDRSGGEKYIQSYSDASAVRAVNSVGNV